MKITTAILQLFNAIIIGYILGKLIRHLHDKGIFKGFKKAQCFFSHAWIYGEHKGIQSQPTLRACPRCGKVEKFYGEMARWEGTFGQLWFSKEDWRTDEKQALHEAKEQKLDKAFWDTVRAWPSTMTQIKEAKKLQTFANLVANTQLIPGHKTAFCARIDVIKELEQFCVDTVKDVEIKDSAIVFKNGSSIVLVPVID